jgi:DNA-binding FadR family transcriptional regulator
LNSATGNQSLMALQDIFWVVYHTVHARYVGRPVDAPPPMAVVQRHSDILSAVLRGDVALARQIIEEDLRGAEEWAAKVTSLDGADLAPTGALMFQNRVTRDLDGP